METVSESNKKLMALVAKDYLRKVKLALTEELLGVGFTIEEIAKILGISESSARTLANGLGHIEKVEEA